MTIRDLLYSDQIAFALEAHNGISAKIVEDAGFPLIWASGLTIASSLGHRDCNEVSWTDVCHQVEFMADAVSIPILLDGDTGFGNFNNVRQLVKKLCKYGIAGVCLEDKTFPKINSFIGSSQPLAPIEEFTGKIKAAKDTQSHNEFCVIARTEAFIAGKGVEEALKRAHAYREAGADALVVHSKQTTAQEIIEFCTQWDHSLPLVLIPTKYASTPLSVFEELGVSLLIWANHLLRASINSMRDTAQKIYTEKSLHSTHQQLASLDDIFSLVDEQELREAEKKYTCCR